MNATVMERNRLGFHRAPVLGPRAHAANEWARGDIAFTTSVSRNAKSWEQADAPAVTVVLSEADAVAPSFNGRLPAFPLLTRQRFAISVACVLHAHRGDESPL